MRQFAWYSPEIDVIVFQILMDNCEISFEWSPLDMYQATNWDIGIEFDLMGNFLWIPLGEL